MTIGVPFEILATVSSRSTATPLLAVASDAVLVERGTPRWLIIRCPCGCGDDVPVNLDSRSGPAWRLYHPNDRSRVTLFPSVWRDTGCESHFIVWRGKLLLLNESGDDGDESVEVLDLPRLAERVFAVLPESSLASVSEIADVLEEVPWDVLRACRFLSRIGRAVEGARTDRGRFRKRV